MNSKPSACSYVEKNEVRKPRHTAEQVSGATDIQQNKSDTAWTDDQMWVAKWLCAG